MPVLLPCKHSICKSHENEAADKMDGQDDHKNDQM